MEQKYGMGNEHGTLLRNVEAILRDIDIFPRQERSVAGLALENPFHGDAEYAMSTDLSKPLILIQLCERKEKLIDGNHRLYKAQKLGVETVTCCYLTVPHQQKYIVDFDAALYGRIVDSL